MEVWDKITATSILLAMALAFAWAWVRLERRQPSRSETFVPWGGFDVLVAAGTYFVLMVAAVCALSPWFKHVPGQAGWAESAAIWKGRKAAFGAMGHIADYLCMDGVIPPGRLPDVLKRGGVEAEKAA